MILGLGTDLCHIERIAQTYERYGQRFLDRVYTAHEQEIFKTRSSVRFYNRLAMFFAAKEACMKAIGTGLRQGVAWRQIETRHHQSGHPYLQVSGAAEMHAKNLTPTGKSFNFHLSLTDEFIMIGGEKRNIAHAVVILQAV